MYGLPALVSAGLSGGFCSGMQFDSNVLPWALMEEPAPRFDLPPLPGHEPGFSSADLAGHVSLVNTFASWCTPCRTEHPVLTALAATRRGAIHGTAYKATEKAAPAWIPALAKPSPPIAAD